MSGNSKESSLIVNLRFSLINWSTLSFGLDYLFHECLFNLPWISYTISSQHCNSYSAHRTLLFRQWISAALESLKNNAMWFTACRSMNAMAMTKHQQFNYNRQISFFHGVGYSGGAGCWTDSSAVVQTRFQLLYSSVTVVNGTWIKNSSRI